MDIIKSTETILGNKMKPDLLAFYSRKDVQKAMVKLARNREVGVKYGDKGYGKRPDVLQFEGDVLELARNGATSFHVSEERWGDPLVLGGDKSKLDDHKVGWDLLLDVDTKFLSYSKLCAKLIVDALDFYDIKSVGVKFSGGSGMHIMIPFETFPEFVNNKETRLLFPEAVRVVALYLKNMITEPLRKELLKMSNVNEIVAASGKKYEEVVKDNILDPFCVVDIDPILISHRHLFRSVYSVNEKTGFVSVPVKKEEIMNFNLKMAKMENVKTDVEFIDMDNIVPGEASGLMIQAFDWYEKNQAKREIKPVKKIEYQIPKVAVNPDMFPPCIVNVLQGVKTDGRKRSLFLLVNFLRQSGYDFEHIEEMLVEWNKKNYEPLREGYIKSQVEWCKKQRKDLMPPNCDNVSYYRDLNICVPDPFFCRHIKNPVQFKKKS